MLDVSVSVDLPADIVGGRSPVELAAELRELAVLEAFRRGDIGSGRGGRLLGIARVAFLDLCAKHDISVLGYDAEDLRREVGDIRVRGF
jgi:predicted HTH domain antitoxin